MGVYRSHYLGVFIEIDNSSVETKESYYINKNGKKFKNGEKFDPNTGEELVKKTIVKSSIQQHYHPFLDVDGFDEDTFFTPTYTDGVNNNKNGFVTALVNHTHKQYSPDIDIKNPSNFSFNNVEVDKIIEYFKVDYKKYLDHLVKMNLSYRVRYGVVIYDH